MSEATSMILAERRGPAWLTVAQAAEHSGLDERTIRHLAATKWFPEMAKTEAPADGGKSRWVIREDADKRLAAVKFPSDMRPDLRELTTDQREAWEKRVAIYQRWQSAIAAAIREGGTAQQATAAFIVRLRAEGIELNERTLRRWHKWHRAEGYGGLIDDRCRREGKPAPKDPFLEEAVDFYLRSRLSVAEIWRTLCAEASSNGWRVWSLRATQRWIMQATNKGQRIFYREGKKAYEDQAEPYLERDYSTYASNQVWVSDHMQFDVLIETGRRMDYRTGEARRQFARPWLTSWMDCRSRRIVGHVIYFCDPCTDMILLALARAVKAHGIPEEATVDGGKDFGSWALHGSTKWQRRKVHMAVNRARILGVFGQLQIKVHTTEPYHAQSKVVERFHETLHGQFDRLWPTFCGSTPADRPDDCQVAIDAGKAPSPKQFRDKADIYIERYNASEHTGDSMDGKTPNVVFAENLAGKRTAPEEVLDLMLQKPSQPVTVGRNGVTWNGQRYGAREPAMNRRISGVATPEDMREAMREKKHDSKVLREYKGIRRRMYDDLPERMERIARDRIANQARPDASLPPPTICPIRSPFEEQLPAVQRALQARVKAEAGAESLDLLAIANARFDLVPAGRKPPQFSLLKAMMQEDEAEGERGAA